MSEAPLYPDSYRLVALSWMTTLAMEGKGRDAMLNEVAMLDQAGMKALTTAIGVLGPRLAAAAMKPRGRRAEDLSIARWFETYKLTAKFPELPGISDEAADLLSRVLAGEEIQAALQDLLAVRLTDGSNAEAGQAREVFRLTVARK